MTRKGPFKQKGRGGLSNKGALALTRQRGQDGLTFRERRFVEEYALDFNGAAAARRAGYSVRTAKVQASQLLTKPNLLAAVEKVKAQRLAEAGVEGTRVLQELKAIGFSDIRDVATWDQDEQGRTRVSLTPSEEMSPDAARAVQSIAMTEHGPAIKMRDKLPALVKLGEYAGIFGTRGRVPPPGYGSGGGRPNIPRIPLVVLQQIIVRARAAIALVGPMPGLPPMVETELEIQGSSGNGGVPSGDGAGGSADGDGASTSARKPRVT